MPSTTPNLAALLTAAGEDLIIKERGTPSPGTGEILVRNIAIAVNPVDWKRQAWGFAIPSFPAVLGSDVCGVVMAVGPSVTNFKVDDRVIGYADSFSSGNDDHAAFQTYTVVKASSAAQLPDGFTFDQGVLMPMAAGTSSIALFHVLGLPKPAVSGAIKPTSSSPAVLIWGGSSAVGTMAIQLSHLAGMTVFTTGSEKNHEYLRSLGADYVFDYKSATVVEDILAAAKKTGKNILYAVDTNADAESLRLTAQVLSKSGRGSAKLASLLPAPEGFQADNVEVIQVNGEEVWTTQVDLSVWLFNEFLPQALERGSLVPSPRLRVVEGGLAGLQTAMNILKEGTVSAQKLIVKLE